MVDRLPACSKDLVQVLETSKTGIKKLVSLGAAVYDLPFKDDTTESPNNTIAFSGKLTKKCYVDGGGASDEQYIAFRKTASGINTKTMELLVRLPTTRSTLYKQPGIQLGYGDNLKGVVQLFKSQDEFNGYRKAAGVEFKDPKDGNKYPKESQAHFLLVFGTDDVVFHLFTDSSFKKLFKKISLRDAFAAIGVTFALSFTPTQAAVQFGFGYTEGKNITAQVVNDTAFLAQSHGSTSWWIILLVIFIILAVVGAIAGGVFYFKKKRRTEGFEITADV